MPNILIGELLILEGLIDKEKIYKAILIQKKKPDYLGYILIKNNFIPIKQFQKFLNSHEIEEEDRLLKLNISKEIIQKLSSKIAWSYFACPLAEINDTVITAFPYLPDDNLINSLSQLISKKIKVIIFSKKNLYRALVKYFPIEPDRGTILPIETDYGKFIVISETNNIKPKSIAHLQLQDSASEWLRSLLANAIKGHSKKIMIFKQKEQSIVEYDKKDRPLFPLPKSVYNRMQRLLTALASIYTAYKSPQRGFIELIIKNKTLYLIVDSTPDVQGLNFKLEIFNENILNTQYANIEKNYPETIELLENFFSQQQGLLIIASPPSLDRAYSIYPIIYHAKKEKSLLVIEDTISYPLKNVDQLEISSYNPEMLDALFNKILLNKYDATVIASAMQRKIMDFSFLASTHNKIIALMHSFDTSKAIEWLLKMGFKSPIKAGVLKGIIFFRLLTKVCPTCKIKFPIINYISYAPLESEEFYTNSGCSFCLDPLSYEKFILVETVPINDKIISSIINKDTADSIKLTLKEFKIKLLGEKALELASKGLVDAQEVLSLIK